MAIIKIFDRANVKVMSERPLALLTPFQVEFGVTLTGTTEALERDECNIGFKLLLPVNEELEAKQFHEWAPRHGIPAQLLGKEVAAQGNV